MGVRTPSAHDRAKPSRSAKKQSGRDLARIAMRNRFARYRDGADDAWDGADDAQLYEYYLWMQRLVWKREPDSEWAAGVQCIRRMRARADMTPAEVFDFLQWWSERDEWCRENASEWRQGNVFIACSDRTLERYRQRVSR